MTLTKRHFERTAAILLTIRGDLDRDPDMGPRELLRRVERHLCDWYASENPTFDRERFLLVARGLVQLKPPPPYTGP